MLRLVVIVECVVWYGCVCVLVVVVVEANGASNNGECKN